MLRIKDGFVLREIAGNWLVIPAGERCVEYNSVVSLNTSGSLLWEGLAKGADIDELTRKIMDEYEIDEATAKEDVMEFVNIIEERGLLEKC